VKLSVIRQIVGEQGISGELFLDGIRFCFTLENRALAIPEGTFPVELEYSPKFVRLLPEIKGIPGRDECKFHVANWPQQLQGCIAVGRVRARDAVLGSELALNALMTKLIAAKKSGETFELEITKEETC
jgi:hypothetical protein